MQELGDELKGFARARGAAVFGVADVAGLRRDYPEELRLCPGDYARGVVLGVRLSGAVLEGIVDRPTPLYFHHYRQVNFLLDRMALELADELQSRGHRALALPASQYVQRDPPRGQVSHKLLGWQAGLGWRGRNNLLVSPRFGAQVRYVSILTDAELGCGAPLEKDCGSCRACIGVCPAGAIREDPLEFDLEACYAKLSEFAKAPFIGQHICGVCVRACSPEAAGGVG
jgi:epoxyqueuosine reductase QueG